VNAIWTFLIVQHKWVTTVGLLFDIVGVLILARDIYKALNSEQQTEHQLHVVGELALRPATWGPGEPVSPPELSQRPIEDSEHEPRPLVVRRQWATFGIVLVVIGFAFQLAAAWLAS